MKHQQTKKSAPHRLLCLLLCTVMLVALFPSMTISAAAATQLGTPTELTWNKALDYGTATTSIGTETKYGNIIWKAVEPYDPEEVLFDLRLYKDGVQVFKQYFACYADYLGNYGPYLEYSFSDNYNFDTGKYYFTVQALAQTSGYSDSEIAKSKTWSYTKPSGTLSKPTGLACNWPEITWKGAGADTYYELEVRHSPGEIDGVGTTYSSITIQETSYNLAKYSLDGWGAGYYAFRVRAYSTDITKKCHSDWTEYSDPYYYDGNWEPSAPTIKSTNVASSGKIKLTWDAVPGAAKYQVYRATSKTGTYKLMKTTTSTSYVNTSAEAGKTYYYKVRAVTWGGTKSSYSNIVTRTCDLERPEISVSNVASSGKVKVSWDKVDGAVKYQVYRATSKTGEYNLVKTTTKTSFTNTGAVAGKTYYYKVKAVAEKSAANSAYSEVKSRTCDLERPDVSISRSSKGDPKLTWDKVDGAVEYKVYRATSKNSTYKLMKTTTKTSYTNTSATAGKTYYYKVKAIASKSAANSAYSTVDSIKAK